MTFDVPAFVTVEISCGAVVPSTTFPKASVDGFVVTGGRAGLPPVPESATVCGLFEALST